MGREKWAPAQVGFVQDRREGREGLGFGRYFFEAHFFFATVTIGSDSNTALAPSGDDVYSASYEKPGVSKE